MCWPVSIGNWHTRRCASECTPLSRHDTRHSSSSDRIASRGDTRRAWSVRSEGSRVSELAVPTVGGCRIRMRRFYSSDQQELWRNAHSSVIHVYQEKQRVWTRVCRNEQPQTSFPLTCLFLWAFVTPTYSRRRSRAGVAIRHPRIEQHGSGPIIVVKGVRCVPAGDIDTWNSKTCTSRTYFTNGALLVDVPVLYAGSYDTRSLRIENRGDIMVLPEVLRRSLPPSPRKGL